MSKSLFDLIKTLSRAEKRVFSEKLRRTKRMSYYAKLVAVYSKSEVYTPKIDERIFRSETPKFISDCKTKCKHLLCDYLVTLEKNKGIRKQVEQKLKVALMLKNRRQFTEAKKLLEKIELVATRYELLDQLIQIKTQKISISILLGGDNRKLDLDNLKALAQDANRTIQHLANFHNARNNSLLAIANYHINNGTISSESEENKPIEDQFKNLGTTLHIHHKNLYEYLNKENHKNALEETKQIISIIEQHKDIVLDAQIMAMGYHSYLYYYVSLSTMCNAKVDIELILKRFDHISCHSVKMCWEVLTFKKLTACVYALAINNPRIAVPMIEETEQYLKKYDYMQKDNSGNALFPIGVYFALGAWKECLLHIDRTETNIITQKTGSVLSNFKLICIYEQNDHYYFNALVNKLMAKKRKGGAKTSDLKNMNDTIFYILYCMSKKTNNIEAHFKRLLNNFDSGWRFCRYFIHWIACQFPELLNGEDYAAFLEKYGYQHYDFTALKADKMFA